MSIIPRKIYLRENELKDQFICERMVYCDASIGSCNIEYTNLSQIWHDAVEEPKEATDMLFVSKNGKVHKVSKIDNSLFDWLKDNDGIDKWAYISDLLPKY